MKWSSVVSLACIVATATIARGASSTSSSTYNDQVVESLPGFASDFPSTQSTGYINLANNPDKRMFFWHSEAFSNADTAPLIFWYQGGPGCSGLGGLFTENGPFRVDSEGTVTIADITWNSFANMVWPEAPVGVGFSYSSDPDRDYRTNDTQAAIDNFNFVEEFLQTHPQYAGRPLYLAGESYAGVYLPTLANEIIANPDSMAAAQLAGIMDGNPVIGCDSLNYFDALMTIFYGHTLISQSTWDQWKQNDCKNVDFYSTSNITDLYDCYDVFVSGYTEVGSFYQEISGWKGTGNQPSLDPDDLYTDFITGNATLDFALTRPNPSAAGDPVVEYLNRADVQEAIHAHTPPADDPWGICTNNELFNYSPNLGSMIPFWQNIINEAPQVNILIYSGDIDIATVPAEYTQRCLTELNGTPVSSWTPYTVNGATVGYTEKFEEYTYATVKGAGHTVPMYQGNTAFHMVQRFINGGDLQEPGYTVSLTPYTFYSDADEQEKKSKTKKTKKPLTQADMLRRALSNRYAALKQDN